MQRILRYTLALLFCATAGSQAGEVLLRLNPDANAPTVARVDETSTTIQRSTQVANPFLAQNGWKQSQHKVSIEGYISTAKMSKNFEIELQTPLSADSSLNGTPLTRIEQSDQIKVLKVADQWAQLRVTKTLSVYFEQLTRPVTPLAPITMVDKPTYRRDTNDKSYLNDFDPARGVGITRPEALPPENVVWRSSNSAPIPRPEPKPKAPRITPAPLSQATAAQQTTFLPGVIYRFSGTLAQAGNALQLEDSQGNRLADVDISQMYINDITPYLNQQVYIHGEVQLSEGHNEVIAITARTIRIDQ
ncbi:MAG: hypothetical protein NWR08_08400 [Opitutales bacterium]|nr:hypothetical protein [Opitutales bacterium]